MFGKDVVTFRFHAANRGMAESIADVLGRSTGQSLRDLGMLYIPDSEE
jgi:hypothetical protein